MAWIFVDKGEDGMSGMRSQMRRNMRSGSGYRTTSGGSNYHEGYRMGYKHGWEDKEDDFDEEEMDFRRRRDSRGRYM